MGESDTDAHTHPYGVAQSDAFSDADGDCHRFAFCVPHCIVNADCHSYLRLPDACRQRNTFA